MYTPIFIVSSLLYVGILLTVPYSPFSVLYALGLFMSQLLYWVPFYLRQTGRYGIDRKEGLAWVFWISIISQWLFGVWMIGQLLSGLG